MQSELEGVDQGRAAQGEERHDPKQRALEAGSKLWSLQGFVKGCSGKYSEESHGHQLKESSAWQVMINKRGRKGFQSSLA